MSQQLGIILMVDVEGAIKANTLEGNFYMFDNMKLQGSEGLGTDRLVSAINGTCYSDGSQADEQVLNWLPYGIGALPPTLPKAFLTDKAKNSDHRTLDEIKQLHKAVVQGTSGAADIAERLKEITKKMGVKTKGKSRRKKDDQNQHDTGHKIMDVTGELINVDEGEHKIRGISSLNPVITNITGEAVDKNIIYPAAYGSPDMMTDGWYWAASVDSSKPGTYAYTMHIHLHKLSSVEGEWTWVPVEMTCDAYIKVSNDPKVNGFTGGPIGRLPI